MYKLNTPDFNKVNRSRHGKGTDLKQDIVDCIRKNCFIPTSIICFLKCKFCLTGKDYAEAFLREIRPEQRRSIVTKNATIQQFSKNLISK